MVLSVLLVGNMRVCVFSEIEVPFPSEQEAVIACNSLRVDAEPRRSGCSKVLRTEGAVLKA